MLKSYFKIAFRSLIKNKLNSTINIGGLALGMATAVLLSLWVYNEFSYDSYHKKAKNIYRVTSHIEINKNETWDWGTTPMLLSDMLIQNFPEVKDATRFFTPWGDVNVKINGNLLTVGKLIYVDKNWFDIFDYKVLEGSVEELIADKNNIAITQSKAKELFGEGKPLDNIVQLDSLNLVVKAVIEDYPANISFKFDVLALNDARLANKQVFKVDNNWDNFNYQTYLVCDGKADLKLLTKKMTTAFRKEKDDKESSNSLKLQALTEIHFDDSIQIGELMPPVNKNVLLIFAGIAILILLTACINYVNLTTANISLRNKEVSIKKFMGVSKQSLFSQFFIESSLTSVTAMLLSIGLLYLGLPYLESITDTHFEITNNPLVWQILGGITLLSIFLNGVYPSLLLTNLQPLELIKGKSAVGSKSTTLRKGLVVFQFSFTMALLICTFLIFSQLRFIQHKDLGYSKEQVFSFSLPWYADKSGNKTEAIFNQIKQESKIVDVTRSNGDIINFNNTHSGSLDWAGRDKEWNPPVSPMSVASNFKSFFDLKLKSGRWFSNNNSSDNNHFILNETAVKEFKLKEPVVGQKFSYQERKGQIIGVAKDFNFKSPKEKITPLLFYKGNARQNNFSIKADEKNISGSIAVVEKIWKANMPDVPFKYSFLDDSFAKLHEAEAKQLQLFYIFGTVVLLISLIGLFGLATFAAEIRIKEIGIRKVLGASVLEIVNLLSLDFVKLIFISILVASPLAWWAMDKWLQNFAYRININWWAFALPACFVMAFVLITVGYKAISAALVNPVESLKTE